MMMTPRLRKLLLTAHITLSVGWLGAVAAFLALAVAGLTSKDAQMVRGACLAMGVIGSFVIVPLALTSLVVGVVQALLTPWGLFRHYWVVFKLLITTLATMLLLVHMRPITYLAHLAAQTTLSPVDHRSIRTDLAGKAGAALLALLVATALSVYKPGGMTAYGQRKHREQYGETGDHAAISTPPWVYFFGVLGLILLVLIRHLTMSGHVSHDH